MVFSVKSDFIGAEIASQPYPNIRLFPIAQAAAWAPQPDVPTYNGSATPCWWPQNPPAQWWDMPYKCNTWQTAMPNVTDEFRCGDHWHLRHNDDAGAARGVPRPFPALLAFDLQRHLLLHGAAAQQAVPWAVRGPDGFDGALHSGAQRLPQHDP